jgi:hypothetical protein
MYCIKQLFLTGAPRICSYLAVKKTVMANLIFGVG